MIYTVTLNPAVDRELTVKNIQFDTVLRAASFRVDCGGKGFNVTRMLKSLGLSSVVLGFAAGKTGELLQDELNALGIETDFVWVAGETRTNVSIVTADHAHYVKVNEPGPTISDADLAGLMQKVRLLASPEDIWVLAGSLPPGVPPDFYAQMIQLLQGAGAKVFVDTSDQALGQSCPAKPFLVKPNAAEAQMLTGLAVNSPRDIAAAANAILALGPENVVISLGKEGALLADGNDVWFAASPAIIERNPIGAGDSMVAGLVWGLSCQDTLPEALRRGIACGAATAGQPGTKVGELNQVIELLPRVSLSKVTPNAA